MDETESFVRNELQSDVELDSNKDDSILSPENSSRIAEALSNPKLTHDEFYKVMRENLSLGQVKRHLDLMGDEFDSEQMFGKLESATGSKEYNALLVEPHIAFRFDHFLDFVEEYEGDLPGIEKLREEYIAGFENKKYYRSLVLKEGLQNDIADREGFLNLASRRDWEGKSGSGIDRVSKSFVLGFQPLDADFATHIEMGATRDSFFHSVSEDPDFSEGVISYLRERDKWTNDLSVSEEIYTFQIEMNSFYSIELKPEYVDMELSEGARWETYRKGFFGNKIEKTFESDPLPEQLLSLHVPAEKIELFRKTRVSDAPRLRFVGEKRLINR